MSTIPVSVEGISGRRRRILASLALPASFFAVSYLVLGIHDALVAAQIGQRVIGIMLTLCGLALLAAALLVFAYESSITTPIKHLWVAPTLFLAGVAPGVLLLILQLSAFRFDWWRISLELIAALIPLTAVVVLWPSHRPRSFKAVTSILSAGLVVTAGQALLGSYYAPVKRGDSLSVLTQLTSVGERREVDATDGGRMQALRGTVSIENAGDAKLVFLGGIYLVTGYEVQFRHPPDQAKLSRTLGKELADRSITGQVGVGRYEAGPPKETLVKAGVLFDPGTNWIAAGTKVGVDFLAYAPKGRFDRYTSTILVVTARADRMNLSAPPELRFEPMPTTKDGPAGVTAKMGISETSWVNFVTRGKRFAFITYTVPTYTKPTAPWPNASPCVAARQLQCKDPLQRRWNDTYGVNLFPAWSSLEDSS